MTTHVRCGAALLVATFLSSPGIRTANAEDLPLQTLMSALCKGRAFDIVPYNASANRAEIAISPNGSFLTEMPAFFDENDALRVTVYGDLRLLPLLHVARKSIIRTVGGINVLGSEIKVPVGTLPRPADKAAKPAEEDELEAPQVDPCGTRDFVVRDFAPGRGEVEISVSVGDTNISIGTFDFNVDATYSGMFSLGAAWTPLMDASFSVAQREAGPAVVATETGTRRLSYVVMYTPFLWDKLERDVRKTPQRPWYRINPSFGFVVDDPLNNVVLGATVDIRSAVLFTGGVYFSHVHRLDGMAVGEPFTGGTADLPVTRRWDRDWFFAVSLDMRVAARLINTVLGSAQ
jgi:hypothetical protein